MLTNRYHNSAVYSMCYSWVIIYIVSLHDLIVCGHLGTNVFYRPQYWSSFRYFYLLIFDIFKPFFLNLYRVRHIVASASCSTYSLDNNIITSCFVS